MGPVELEALQPKKAGRLLRPRLMNVLKSGIEGNAVPFSMVLFSERSYVATREEPLGQLLLVSAEESTAKMTSTSLAGWIRGYRGMFWLSSPPSTSVSSADWALRFVALLKP